MDDEKKDTTAKNEKKSKKNSKKNKRGNMTRNLTYKTKQNSKVYGMRMKRKMRTMKMKAITRIMIQVNRQSKLMIQFHPIHLETTLNCFIWNSFGKSSVPLRRKTK